jgi:hypothetical protein
MVQERESNGTHDYKKKKLLEGVIPIMVVSQCKTFLLAVNLHMSLFNTANGMNLMKFNWKAFLCKDVVVSAETLL